MSNIITTPFEREGLILCPINSSTTIAIVDMLNNDQRNKKEAARK